MRIQAAIEGNLEQAMRTELLDATEGVVKATNKAVKLLQHKWRGQVVSGGLGKKLPKTIRSKFYENKRINAAGIVYTRAPEIMTAFEEGATIQAKSGGYLAIPTEKAKKLFPKRRRNSIGRFAKRGVSPANWDERRYGKLVSFQRNRGDGYVLAVKKKLKRKTKYTIMFTLIPQVRLSKRLDVARANREVLALYPKMIEREYGTRGERSE